MKMIDKLAWIEIRDRKVLYVRSKGKDLFYNAGGKRDLGESDSEALRREIREELKVELVPETLQYLHTFTSNPDGAQDAKLRSTCFRGECVGEPEPDHEIEELAWFTSADGHRTTDMGRQILRWLKERDLID